VGCPEVGGRERAYEGDGGLIDEGKDWHTVELAARLVMNDLWMLESEQTKALAIVRNRWERQRGVADVHGRRAEDIVEELDGLKARSPGVPLARLIDLRHELTALIKSDLYGGGNKMEGRAALMARRHLDEFFFHTEQSHLVRGNGADLDVLKRAIVLTTLAEQVTLLEQARDAGGGSGKGIKLEMLKLMNDPDRFDRFNDEDKAAIREIARGVSLFAKTRFNHLHEAIRRRGIPYMPS